MANSPVSHPDSIKDRETVLWELLTELTCFPEDGDNPALFQRLFSRARAVLGLTDTELAHNFQVSLDVIAQWSRADTAPSFFMRKRVIRHLADRVADKRLDLIKHFKAADPVVLDNSMPDNCLKH